MLHNPLIMAALTGSLFLSLAFSIASGSSESPTRAAAVNTIPMGQTDMKGGTTKIGEVDPDAIPTAGPDAAGKVCNDLSGGPVIQDLTFSIKQGSAGTLEVSGSNSTPFDANGKASVTFASGSGLSGKTCRDYVIKGLAGDDSGDNLILNVTPSFTATLSSSSVELNSLPEFRLDAMSDLARNGIAELYHAGVLFQVSNDDPGQGLTEFHGVVTFPGASSSTVASVHLMDTQGDELATLTTTVSGNEFTITNFAELHPGYAYRIVIRLSEAIGGEPMRVQLQAVFAP